MWKNYLKSDDIIEIKITEEMTKESFFNEIVNKLEVYIEIERESESGNESELSGTASVKVPVLSLKTAAKQKSGDNSKVKYIKAANSGLTLTTVTDEVTRANKIIIMVDFHIANSQFVKEISRFLVNESFHKAYVLQGLCRTLCNLEDVRESSKIKKKISNFDNAKKTFEYLTSSEDSTYANTIRVIAQAGRKSNKQQTYLWLLRVLKNYPIGEEGIELKDIFQRIRELGNAEMTQGSINSCVAHIPLVLETNRNVLNVFKYENKRLYVMDEFFQFYLKWSRDLCNELQIN